jgi:hypothetical protein
MSSGTFSLKRSGDRLAGLCRTKTCMSAQNNKARYATAHWIRFPGIVTPDQLALTESPSECLSWKIGPDGPVGPDGYRLPSNIWCGVGLFRDLSAAENSLQGKQRFLPCLADATESWHALLLPIAHRGECNHVQRTNAGLIFDIDSRDPGGPLFVMTTVGFNPGPGFDLARVIDFRVQVDQVHDWLKSVAGRVASQVFTPHTVGDDGVTMSVWRNDTAMIEAMYQHGAHRTQIDRYKSEQTADRTSFTRFRLLRTSGRWDGIDPLEAACSGVT